MRSDASALHGHGHDRPDHTRHVQPHAVARRRVCARSVIATVVEAARRCPEANRIGGLTTCFTLAELVLSQKTYAARVTRQRSQRARYPAGSRPNATRPVKRCWRFAGSGWN
jgi:hypothetical protein